MRAILQRAAASAPKSDRVALTPAYVCICLEVGTRQWRNQKGRAGFSRHTATRGEANYVSERRAMERIPFEIVVIGRNILLREGLARILRDATFDVLASAQ